MKDFSIFDVCGFDITWDEETCKMTSADLQLVVTKVASPFQVQTLKELTTLIACGEVETLFGKKHEVEVYDLDEWYENKLKKMFKEIMVKNGTIVDEQAKTIEELTEACKASLK
jgi:phage-related tail protein